MNKELIKEILNNTDNKDFILETIKDNSDLINGIIKNYDFYLSRIDDVDVLYKGDYDLYKDYIEIKRNRYDLGTYDINFKDKFYDLINDYDFLDFRYEESKQYIEEITNYVLVQYSKTIVYRLSNSNKFYDLIIDNDFGEDFNEDFFVTDEEDVFNNLKSVHFFLDNFLKPILSLTNKELKDFQELYLINNKF